MKKYTKTYRITIDEETFIRLNNLRKYHIIPMKFVRNAIIEALDDFIKPKEKKRKYLF